MTPGAFESFVEKRLAAEPEARLARALVGSTRAIGHEAYACLEHEWLELAFGVRDPAIAVAKLAWWRDELARYAAGKPQHPVLQALAGRGSDRPDATVGSSAAALEGALGAAAQLAVLESPGTVDDLLEPFRRYATAALPMLGAHDRETAPVEAYAAALATQQVRQWPRFARPDRAAVPLKLLATAGLNRAALVEPRHAAAAARVAALLASELEAALAATPRAAPLAARIVTARAVARRIAARPAEVLDGSLRAPPLRLIAALWRIGRRDRH